MSCESIKRVVRVTITKEIEVELTSSVFGEMSLDEYLAGFRNSLWHVDGIDDVAIYAAGSAAVGQMGVDMDGVGLIDHHYSTFPRKPDVSIRILSDECESEIIAP